MFLITLILNWFNDLIYQRSLGEIEYDVNHDVADGRVAYTDAFGETHLQDFTCTNRRAVRHPRMEIISRMFSDIVESGNSPHYIILGDIVFTQFTCYRLADFEKQENERIAKLIHFHENPQPRHFNYSNEPDGIIVGKPVRLSNSRKRQIPQNLYGDTTAFRLLPDGLNPSGV